MEQHKIIRDRLRNDFPSVYVKDIDTTLKTNKYSYVASYYYLENALISNSLKLKTVKTKLVNSITNYELPELESVFNAINPKLECNCCCDDKPFEEFGQCTDGHIICKICIKKHAENMIYQQLSCKIKCINCNEKCFGEFNEDALQSILSERVFAEYKNLKKMDEMKELCVDDINIKICQHCGAGTDVGENFEQYLLICMECFKDTCLKCNQVDHPGKPCYSLGNVVQSKRQEIEDKMSEALIVKCNSCDKSIFKNEGCNKVTCICGTHNCYVCKQIIPKSIGYSHFCRNHDCSCNKCHLWEQNTKKRLLDAVKDNYDYDKETQKLIEGLL
jgi:TRIAD3 protein (E3 ubiquitin-protein ligase RNF216)